MKKKCLGPKDLMSFEELLVLAGFLKNKNMKPGDDGRQNNELGEEEDNKLPATSSHKN